MAIKLDQKLLDRAYGTFDGTNVLAMRKAFQLVLSELIKDGKYNPVPLIAKSLVTDLLTALGDKGFEMLDDPAECKKVISGLIENLMEDSYSLR